MNLAALRVVLNGDPRNAVVASTPGGIEAQEARGQRDFVASTTLPKECLYCTREQLEEMGIIFGDDADDLFVNVQLPEGWKKVATAPARGSYLVDEQGRKRASIFYKAALYDRRAHISLARRFSFRDQPVGGYDSDYDKKTCERVCVVTDCDMAIWTSEKMAPSAEIEWFNLSQHVVSLGVVYLDEHYPDWKDPLAYWD